DLSDIQGRSISLLQETSIKVKTRFGGSFLMSKTIDSKRLRTPNHTRVPERPPRKARGPNFYEFRLCQYLSMSRTSYAHPIGVSVRRSRIRRSSRRERSGLR